MNNRLILPVAALAAGCLAWTLRGAGGPDGVYAGRGEVHGAEDAAPVNEVASSIPTEAQLAVVELRMERVSGTSTSTTEGSLSAPEVAAAASRDLEIRLTNEPEWARFDGATVELLELEVEAEDEPWGATIDVAAQMVRVESAPTGRPVLFTLLMPANGLQLRDVIEIPEGASHALASIEIDVDRLVGTSEAAAVATLRSIAAAQQQLQASAAIDTDADGGGEFGYFGELAGAIPIRQYDRLLGTTHGAEGGVRLDPTFLPSSMGKVDPVHGTIERGGYLFRIYLPSADSDLDENHAHLTPLREAGGGGAGRELPDAAASEVIWCCYAWPVREGIPSDSAFFINQNGDVLVHRNSPYFGPAGGPDGDAAFSEAGNMGSLPGIHTLGQTAQDGGAWHPVGL